MERNVSLKKLEKAEEHLDEKIFGLALKHLPVLRNILVEAYFEKFWSLKQEINNKNITSFRYKCILKVINKIDQLSMEK